MSANRIYNWKKGPEDERDIPSTRHLRVEKVTLPAEFELDRKIPIYDQLALGSCTSNSGCACYRYEWAQKKNNFDFEPSRLFLYWNTRYLEGTTNEDSGAYIRDVFKALNKWGLAPEEDFPYVISTFTKKPTDLAFQNGLKNLVIKYTSVLPTETVIKQTLLSGAAISFGFNVYQSFEVGNWDSTTGIMPIPKKGESLLGGHAVTITGWNDSKKCFKIQNSWGEEWGLGGYFWMPYSFLLNPSECDDFWCIDEIRIVDKNPEPEINWKEVAIKIFTSASDLHKCNEDTVVRLGILLGLDVNKKYSFKDNWQTVCSFLDLK